MSIAQVISFLFKNLALGMSRLHGGPLSEHCCLIDTIVEVDNCCFNSLWFIRIVST